MAYAESAAVQYKSAGVEFRNGWQIGRNLAIESGSSVKVKKGSKVVIAMLQAV